MNSPPLSHPSPELVAKWNGSWALWHWCFGYRGPTLCGIKRLSSIGACTPGPRNYRDMCKRCRAAKRRWRDDRRAPLEAEQVGKGTA